MEKVTKDKTVFAKGCDFYKIVMLFLWEHSWEISRRPFSAASQQGVWMSRSSVVWGPFSIVWGLAIAMVTAMLYKYKDRSDGFLFWTGTFRRCLRVSVQCIHGAGIWKSILGLQLDAV